MYIGNTLVLRTFFLVIHTHQTQVKKLFPTFRSLGHDTEKREPERIGRQTYIRWKSSSHQRSNKHSGGFFLNNKFYGPITTAIVVGVLFTIQNPRFLSNHGKSTERIKLQIVDGLFLFYFVESVPFPNLFSGSHRKKFKTDFSKITA